MNTSLANKSYKISGSFDLVCAADGAGKTYIREQFVKAPFHLSKPHWLENVLLVQAVNSTAGVFAGDELKSSVCLEKDARVLFTTPSAHRIYTMPEGEARMEQKFIVAENSWLEVMPELFVPHAGCAYWQKTEIDVKKGGELFFVEMLAPGRVAHGETLEFRQIDWSLDLYYDRNLLVRENYFLKPDHASVWSLQRMFDSAYFASCYLVSERCREVGGFQKAVEALNSDHLFAGASQLVETCWSIKLLASSSQALRDALQSLRKLLNIHFVGLSISARKL